MELLIELQKSQKRHHRIIQKQMKEKYSRTEKENYWWCKVNMIIYTYNKEIVKSNRIEVSQNEPPKLRSRDGVEINYESRQA